MTAVSGTDNLRELPSIHVLLAQESVGEALAQYPRSMVVAALRAAVGCVRDRLIAGSGEPSPTAAEIVAEALARLAAGREQGLRAVINATGVIVHTNLGRSPLAESAARAAYEAARSYTNLEADLESGRRSSRHGHIEERLAEVLGAPAGAAFNNNAAAVMLALGAIAGGREVIVSRGQLVEIGGSFRVPEVISHSGCLLREVGATNRTHLRDYEAAIGEQTAAILRAHASNYRIIGFTAEPTLRELCDLAHRHGLPLIDDLGSGALLDLSAFGVGEEPTVPASLAAGADIVTFSGDKLLGGPQCGIALGRPDLIERMKRHPFARAVRVDKMTIAALAATLDLFRDPARALREIPTLRAATEPIAAVQERAGKLAELIRAGTDAGVGIAVVAERSARVGGGSLPEQELATACVRITTPEGPSANELARRLRTGDPSVYPRVHEHALVLDARTIFPEQIEAAGQAVVVALECKYEQPCCHQSAYP